MLAELVSTRSVTPVAVIAERSPGVLAQSTLDLLPMAIVIVDEDAQILHQNSAAVSMLQDGVPILSRHAKLTSCCAAASVALRSEISRVAKAQAPANVNSSIALPYLDGRVAIAHVRVLSEIGQCCAQAAVFITTPTERAPKAPLGALASLFRLTKTEVRVLEQIVAGRNRKEAAAALRVSDSTVATHLKGIYAKTDTVDQLSLCRMVAALSCPAC